MAVRARGKEQVNYNWPKDVVSELKRIAKKEGVNMTSLTLLAVKKFIREYKRNKHL